MLVTRAMSPAPLLFHDDLHLDVLESNLVVNQFEQPDGPLIRHVIATQLDPRRFACELRVRCEHLAIEQKRNVSVKFLLELMKPLVRSIPWPGLGHRENHVSRLSIDPEQINNRWVRHPGPIQFLLLILIVLLILPH